MRIVDPSFTLLYPRFASEAYFEMCKIETAGRTCYKSEEKITAHSHVQFIANLIKKGHLSVIEHATITAKIVCDRGVSHELVRHRLASYSQESTRYCRYENEIAVIKPPGMNITQTIAWQTAAKQSEVCYMRMINGGCSPQIARSVLPNSLKTEIVVTANAREWLHIFELRTSPKAHPQIRSLMLDGQAHLAKLMPPIFGRKE